MLEWWWLESEEGAEGREESKVRLPFGPQTNPIQVLTPSKAHEPPHSEPFSPRKIASIFALFLLPPHLPRFPPFKRHCPHIFCTLLMNFVLSEPGHRKVVKLRKLDGGRLLLPLNGSFRNMLPQHIHTLHHIPPSPTTSPLPCLRGLPFGHVLDDRPPASLGNMNTNQRHGPSINPRLLPLCAHSWLIIN